MGRRILALCLTLAASLTPWSVGAAQVTAEDVSAVPEAAIAETGAGTPATLEIFEPRPMDRTGCRISCNTDFNIFCTSTNLFGCSEGLDSGGNYYIQCDSTQYYCPACPSWDPEHCLD